MPGIKGYRPSKQNQRLHRMRMEGNKEVHPQNGYKPAPPGHGAGEPEVVLGSEIAAVLQLFKDEWYKTRSKVEATSRGSNVRSKQIFGIAVEELVPDIEVSHDGQTPLGPLQYLELHTGLNQKAFSRITTGEQKYVNLSVADNLLQAMNFTHYLHNGTVNIIPNPRWSMEKYISYMESRGCI